MPGNRGKGVSCAGFGRTADSVPSLGSLLTSPGCTSLDGRDHYKSTFILTICGVAVEMPKTTTRCKIMRDEMMIPLCGRMDLLTFFARAASCSNHTDLLTAARCPFRQASVTLVADVHDRRTIRASGRHHGAIARSGRVPLGSRTDLRFHQALHP